MNKDKAIQLLERLQDPDYCQITSEAFDAIQMAIDALSADGNTISRKAAIDALNELATFTDECSEHTWMYIDDVYKAIKQLPPAQPEIVTCDRCVATKRSECIWHNAGATFCSLGEVTE